MWHHHWHALVYHRKQQNICAQRCNILCVYICHVCRRRSTWCETEDLTNSQWRMRCKLSHLDHLCLLPFVICVSTFILSQSRRVWSPIIPSYSLFETGYTSVISHYPILSHYHTILSLSYPITAKCVGCYYSSHICCSIAMHHFFF